MLEFNPNVTAKAVSPYGDGDEKKIAKNEIATGVINFNNGDTKKNEPDGNGFNRYGNDIANFMNFDDMANAAKREATTAAGAIERMVYDFTKGRNDAMVSLPPQPDPNKCGNGNEGYLNYQNELGNWVQTCKKILENSPKSKSKNNNGKVEHKKPVKPEPKPAPQPEPLPEPLPEPKPKKPDEPMRINEHYNAAQVRQASEGPGTNEERFIKNITIGNYSTPYLLREPLNKTEIRAIDKEIREQTNGEKNLLQLIQEEFTLYGRGKDNRKITELYNLYKGYLSDTSMEKG